MKINAIQKLLRAYIAERDALYDTATDDEGSFTDPDDAAEVARMDKIIDAAQAELRELEAELAQRKGK